MSITAGKPETGFRFSGVVSSKGGIDSLELEAGYKCYPIHHIISSLTSMFA